MEALGNARVALIPMGDIWMRDVTPLNAASPVTMRYSAAGQGGGRKGRREARFVQAELEALKTQMKFAGVDSLTCFQTIYRWIEQDLNPFFTVT